MSETAQTLIKASMRVLGLIAPGETPTNDELQDGLEALKIMLRHWSAKNIRLYYTKQDTITLDGSTSYTIGSGGDCDTVRPTSIRGGYLNNANSPIRIIDEAEYRRLRLTNISGDVECVWYNPEYPLGVLYVFPAGGGTLYLDSLKPLTEPSVITDAIAFPPEYDEAIKYGLAVRLAPEYGKQVPEAVAVLAKDGLNDLEIKNFAEQVNAANLEILKLSRRYNIDEG